MKSVHVILTTILAAFVFLFVGCKASETPSNTAARTAASPVSNANATNNSNQSVKPADSNRNAEATKTSVAPTDSAKPKDPSQLIGTYESREVRSEGVVTVMSKLRTIWMFSGDGSYSRVSQVNGKTYHSDSGQFHIEEPDKLVLSIQVTGQKANRKMQNPPMVKTHKYTISPDGDELRLISDKGSVGIFQRVAKPGS